MILRARHKTTGEFIASTGSTLEMYSALVTLASLMAERLSITMDEALIMIRDSDEQHPVDFPTFVLWAEDLDTSEWITPPSIRES